MIIPVAAVIAVLLPAFVGGKLSRLADVQLHAQWLILVSLGMQIVVIELLPGPSWLLRSAHVGSYVLAGAFVWANRELPGVLLLALGASFNGLTIALNDGTLPASAWAMRVAGLHEDSAFANSGVVSHPHLAILGDIFPIPAAWPLSNVFSIGDLLIVTGVAYASACICGTWWSAPRRPPGDSTPAGCEDSQDPAAAARESIGPSRAKTSPTL